MPRLAARNSTARERRPVMMASIDTGFRRSIFRPWPSRLLKGLHLVALRAENHSVPSVSTPSTSKPIRRRGLARAWAREFVIRPPWPGTGRACSGRRTDCAAASSVTSNWLILLLSIICTASTASFSGAYGARITRHHLADRRVRRSPSFCMARRRSPSVKMPLRWLPPASSTTTMPMPPAEMAPSASTATWFPVPAARRQPGASRRRHASAGLRPSAPPGWERAKSSAPKPRASSRATARASPSASAAVVLAVGARLSGQASWSTPASRLDVGFRRQRRVQLPVMAISLPPSRLMSGTMVSSSSFSPEFEMAISTSSRVIMPRSPCTASAAWTK
jgi:hypothetical protein